MDCILPHRLRSVTRGVLSSGRCLLLAALFAVAAVSQTSAQPPRGSKPPPAPVRADSVRLEPAGHRAVSFVGTIKPLNTSLVASSVEGLVEEYLIDEGDYVAKGAVLAKLRTIDQEIEKKRAEADLSLMKLEKEELELSEPREIEKARAEKGAAEALLKFAADRLTRTKKLLETSPEVVTQEELEENISNEAAARENYQAKLAAFELASGGLWKKRIDQADAKVKAQERAIDLLRDELDRHTIKAPFAGYVTKESTEVGQWVAKGGPVAEVIQIDKVDLEVSVLEVYSPNLRVGLEGTVEVDTYPDRVFTGHVALIVPSADPQSRSFPVKIRIDNSVQETPSGDDKATPQMQLKPGMFARASLPVGNSQQLNVVDKDALVLERNKKSVFVVDLDSDAETPGLGTVRQVPVRLGVSYGDSIEVLGDLQPGQIVVTEGNERLNEGRNVRIVNFSELRREDSAGTQTAEAQAR